MPNNLLPVARQAVLNALRSEIVKAKLYGRITYVVPGAPAQGVAYVSEEKDITFSAATSGATTSITMVEDRLEFNIDEVTGINDDTTLEIRGVLLTANDAVSPATDTLYLSAPFGQVFTYESQGKFFLTDLTIFST